MAMLDRSGKLKLTHYQPVPFEEKPVPTASRVLTTWSGAPRKASELPGKPWRLALARRERVPFEEELRGTPTPAAHATWD